MEYSLNAIRRGEGVPLVHYQSKVISVELDLVAAPSSGGVGNEWMWMGVTKMVIGDDMNTWIHFKKPIVVFDECHHLATSNPTCALIDPGRIEGHPSRRAAAFWGPDNEGLHHNHRDDGEIKEQSAK